MLKYVNTICDTEVGISIVLNICHFFVMGLCKLLLLAALKCSSHCFLCDKRKKKELFVRVKEEDQFGFMVLKSVMIAQFH